MIRLLNESLALIQLHYFEDENGEMNRQRLGYIPSVGNTKRHTYSTHVQKIHICTQKYFLLFKYKELVEMPSVQPDDWLRLSTSGYVP